ncbi:MAG: chalcone isomerase family protein [Aquabacterium sp.]|nr:chalcone isomerase family protein [Aquabacterium sp.]
MQPHATHPLQRASRRACVAVLVGSVVGSALLAAGPAVQAKSDMAAPAELASELPGAIWRGSGALRFLGMRIYDARLWSPVAVTGDGANQPLALELIYARSIKGELIVSSSLREMQRVGQFSDEQSAVWAKAMAPLFPNIKPGDRITGVQRPGESARFFVNGTLRGEVADAEFTRLFFGIWLSPRTSDPQLRQQLLGGKR